MILFETMPEWVWRSTRTPPKKRYGETHGFPVFRFSQALRNSQRRSRRSRGKSILRLLSISGMVDPQLEIYLNMVESPGPDAVGLRIGGFFMIWNGRCWDEIRPVPVAHLSGWWFGRFFFRWDDDPIWRTHIFQGGWKHQWVMIMTNGKRASSSILWDGIGGILNGSVVQFELH